MGFVKPLPKNNEVRFQLFSENFLNELDGFAKVTGCLASGLVIQKNGKPLRRNSVVASYNLALKRAGLNHLNGSNLLRRTAGTLGHNKTKDFAAASHVAALSEVFDKAVGDSSSEIKLKIVK